ncbi:MAG: tryptophan synthase subunit alpha [Pseudomonadota bacterium]|nr:tryptophan synthase subunit alpha [Pseudomonadota bacterium]
MNLISGAFKKDATSIQKTTFITYLVCGDPNTNITLRLLNIMVEAGVDLIELGMPFTDPIADGPVIQKGIERSLKSKTTLESTLMVVKNFRKTNKITPIVLMGYMNPIEKMGYEKFAIKANKCGVDGILIVDLPVEEAHTVNKIFKQNQLKQIFLASPTTDTSRLKKIVRYSDGYVYYVSIKGITGNSIKNINSIKDKVKQIQKISKDKVPVAVGFGIKNKSSAKKISAFSDGIIIGSSIVELIEKYIHNKNMMYKKIKSFLSGINKVLDKK